VEAVLYDFPALKLAVLSFHHTTPLHSTFFNPDPYNTANMVEGDVNQAKKSFMGMPGFMVDFLSKFEAMKSDEKQLKLFGEE
jgi:hypothetical protein